MLKCCSEPYYVGVLSGYLSCEVCVVVIVIVIVISFRFFFLCLVSFASFYATPCFHHNVHRSIMGFATHQPMQVKRCTHCQVEKTPQWREGPMGPKTLCNACGVRYRSGRLVPEYRPAASPTFVPSLHSNKHKKVIEMREKAIPDIIF